MTDTALVVTQEDEQALQKYLRERTRRSFGSRTTEPHADLLLQTLARHRIAAEQRARIEGARAGLKAKSAELARMLISNAETWGHEYFRGFDDARQALDPAAVVQP